jgi:Ni,Fe-hydrogenase III component G
MTSSKYYSVLALLMKFSSPFKYSQALDLFSYKNTLGSTHPLVSVFFLTQLGVYAFTFILTGDSLKHSEKRAVVSLEPFFFNFWWLEREVTEMSGLVFSHKVDQRNLLLEYFNTFKPLDRAFPTYGYFELFFNTVRGLLSHAPVSLQI